MVKLSKKVLDRRTIRETLGKLDTSSCDEFKLSELTELYGADAVLGFGYDWGYCCGDDRETEVTVYCDRQETDKEYEARIKAETQRLERAAKTRATTAERKKREELLRSIRAEREERELYLKLRKKFEDE